MRQTVQEEEPFVTLGKRYGNSGRLGKMARCDGELLKIFS